MFEPDVAAVPPDFAVVAVLPHVVAAPPHVVPAAPPAGIILCIICNAEVEHQMIQDHFAAEHPVIHHLNPINYKYVNYIFHLIYIYFLFSLSASARGSC